MLMFTLEKIPSIVFLTENTKVSKDYIHSSTHKHIKYSTSLYS